MSTRRADLGARRDGASGVRGRLPAPRRRPGLGSRRAAARSGRGSRPRASARGTDGQRRGHRRTARCVPRIRTGSPPAGRARRAASHGRARRVGGADAYARGQARRGTPGRPRVAPARSRRRGPDPARCRDQRRHRGAEGCSAGFGRVSDWGRPRSQNGVRSGPCQRGADHGLDEFPERPVRGEPRPARRRGAATPVASCTQPWPEPRPEPELRAGVRARSIPCTDTTTTTCTGADTREACLSSRHSLFDDG